MRIIVCGNQAEHLWPEACVRNLQAMGHEVELIYYLVPQEHEIQRYIPANIQDQLQGALASYEGQRSLMASLFVMRTIDFQPELILLAGMYHTWSAETLEQIRQQVSAPIVLWSGDNPYEAGATDTFTPGRYYDQTLFTIHGLAERAADDYPSTGFLAFGCDPKTDVAPALSLSDRERYRSALSYLGTLKLDRAEVLNGLAQAQLGLRVWCPPPPRGATQLLPELVTAIQPDQIHGARARSLYAASDIVLNLHHYGFGNMKFYEVASCGVFQISNLLSDSQSIQSVLPFFSKAIACDTQADMIERVRHYLINPGAREANARELQEIVHREHTWVHRLQAIIDLVLPAHVGVAQA